MHRTTGLRDMFSASPLLTRGVAGLRGIAPGLPEKLDARQRRSVLGLAGLILLLGAMALGYGLTRCSIWVEVDGQTLLVRSHLPTIGQALQEARILLQPEDEVDPPPDTPLISGLRVRVTRARTVIVNVNGEPRLHRTLATSVGDVLTEAGVRWIPEDRITIEDSVVSGAHPLYAEPPGARHVTSRGGRVPGLSQAPPVVQVDVLKAVPIGVQDGETPYTFLTTASTLGEALLEKGIRLYAADQVEPALDTPITAGLRATIDRSRAVTVLADGQIRQTRTRAETVGQLLQEEGVSLGEMDYAQPGPADAVVPGMRVLVVRVREREVMEEESIPYQQEYRGNPTLEIDQQRVESSGSPGVFRRSLRVRYENDIEVSRSVSREWVERPPQNRVISYGMKIVERQTVTASGTSITYWRRMRVLVTSYTAATSGKARDHPAFGITRVGWRATKGIVAVDPRVIPLFSRMYVPGYGPGVAGDTGGGVLGRHIDLCYDEHNLVLWRSWVDIYLLSPPPPPKQIAWILPNHPRER